LLICFLSRLAGGSWGLGILLNRKNRLKLQNLGTIRKVTFPKKNGAKKKKYRAKRSKQVTKRKKNRGKKTNLPKIR